MHTTQGLFTSGVCYALLLSVIVVMVLTIIFARGTFLKHKGLFVAALLMILAFEKHDHVPVRALMVYALVCSVLCIGIVLTDKIVLIGLASGENEK